MQLESGKNVHFNNILLATDFTPVSESALLQALALARRYKSRVFVANVVNPQALRLLGSDAVQSAVDDAWREAHTEMTNQLIAGRLQGIENKVIVKQGDIWEELSKLIDMYNVDLLVVGTHGRTGVWKMLLGSTAEKIFRSAICPVLTVGPGAGGIPPEAGPKRIMFCTGFGPQSIYAGMYALSLSQQQQAKLAMVHVVKDVPNDSPAERERIEKECKRKLLDLLPPDTNVPWPVETLVGFGFAGDAILKLAEDWRPDLIVLGVRRPEPTARRPFTWATAYRVVSAAPCPVLTVRTPDEFVID